MTARPIGELGAAPIQPEQAPAPSSPPGDETDARLVGLVRTGSDDAFTALVDRHQAGLFRYLHGLVGDAEQAHDLVQDTFVRAFRSLDRLEEPGRLRSWLYRIAHNLACSALRRRRLIRWLPLRLDQHDSAPAPDRVAIESARVLAALDRVPLDQRAPLLLHLVAGFSYAEVGRLLGLSEGAVRMRISRGRTAFRSAFGGEEEDDAP